ncbi:MAG TPA: hypothetical protein VGL61_04730 [Kofleriaceae bacterium]
MSGTVIDSGSAATPIAGATVCILDHSEIPCATTDGNGAYSIELPAVTASPLDVAMNASAEGYLGFTGITAGYFGSGGSIVSTGPGWFSTIPLMSDATAAAILETQAGFQYPPASNAFVQLSVFHAAGDADTGVTVALSPAPGVAAVYADASGALDPALTSITSNGYVWFGSVTPGKIEATVSDSSCVPVQNLADYAWNDSKPHSVAGETVANSVTWMTIICE